MTRNIEAEQAFLGALLFNNRLLHGLKNPLSERHFFDPVHGRIFAACAEIISAGGLADGVTLKERFARDGGLNEIGGAAYFLRLMEDAAPLNSQAIAYAELIRDCARRRAVIDAAKGAVAMSESEGNDEDALTWLEDRLRAIAHDYSDGEAWERLGSVVLESVERAELGEARGISTGIRGLDEATGGIKPGLWVLGAATSMGKSIVASFIARSVAAQGYGVGEHHLEMTNIQIGLRAASALGFDKDPRADNATYLGAMRGALRERQRDAMRGAARASVHLPIYIDARSGRTVSQIEASSRRLLRQFERSKIAPGCIVIDHEGLIPAEQGQRHPSQLERTNARSEALAAMAKRLGVCVIAVSQITKDGARADGETRLPSLLDLNYGGAISQAADVVMLVHRDAYHEERKPAHLRDADKLRSRQSLLIVDKSRDGRRCQVPLLIDPPTAAVWEDAA